MIRRWKGFRMSQPALASWLALLAIAIAVAQEAPRTTYARIALGDRVEAVLSAATDEGYATHAYTVEIPAGATSLTVRIDSEADLDLAVSTRGPITSFEDVEHVNVAPGGDTTYTVGSPPAGTLYVEVLNLTRSRAGYAITVVADGLPASGPTPASEIAGGALPSGLYGALSLPSATEGAIAPGAYHSFWIDVPGAVDRVRIRVDGFGSDLDLAWNVAEPITSYDDVDFLDTSADPDPTVTVDIVGPERLYVDVLNSGDRAAEYRIDVDVPAPSEPKEADANGAPEPTNPLAGGPNVPDGDRWAGSFAGDGLEVVVRREADGYAGAFTLGTRTYPFRARVEDGVLSGAFISAGVAFDFIATPAGDGLRVESGGAVYRTERSADGR